MLNHWDELYQLRAVVRFSAVSCKPIQVAGITTKDQSGIRHPPAVQEPEKRQQRSVEQKGQMIPAVQKVLPG